jgi:hypothetical protein
VLARFSAPVQTDPGVHPASCTKGIGTFQGVESGRGVTLTPHPLLVARAIPLLSLRAFAVCKKGETYLLHTQKDVVRSPSSPSRNSHTIRFQLQVLCFIALITCIPQIYWLPILCSTLFLHMVFLFHVWSTVTNCSNVYHYLIVAK